MKIATYNIWNSNVGMPSRKNQIIKEIASLNADIICLQEVHNEFYHNEITDACCYKYSCFLNHSNEDEGLSILSRFPIEDYYYISYALIATIKVENFKLVITNLHLPWKSALKREECIVNIINTISSIKADYHFILGDFNCSVNSSVQSFLLGDRSLLNNEANPYWYDLAVSYAENSNTILEPTLNVKENPRWKDNNSIELNQRYDRIFIKNTFPNDLPILKNVSIFGKEISDNGYCASDHYGVSVELLFAL